MFIRAEGIIQQMAAQVLARASDKAALHVSLSGLRENRAASAESFTATTDEHALFIQKRQKRNV